MGNEIKNIAEASISILSAPPREAVLAGRTIKCGVVPWHKFQILWNDTAGFAIGLIQALMQFDDPGGDGEAQQAIFRQLAPQMATAPKVLDSLIQCSAGLGFDEYKDAPYPEVLNCAWQAVLVNFVDTTGLRDFFTAMTGAVGSVQATAPELLEALNQPESTTHPQDTSSPPG